ncbi:GNAT family N-acetyltransferase [Sulfitobacter guttiformis]|uniref:Ribosomal protein S18 acetylase RimI-like enzyme n=1 Tax=Sulfitobacter guttiformis TaxID=74349 RepID=A0A420DPE7_9RHOB|nr:GNAT family N-acetyltransferase [Sulfitobacter guttiformis]KIN73440.1 Acetyltransferase, gnat family [Sulfitobacter guttiformis KCTC 32187]RKE96102.1 ribosomal protein S18 acetylase RimI-like enzyme [Sulfitobacter guttiformis]
MTPVMIRPARALDAGKLADILAAANSTLEWLPDLYTSAEEIKLIGIMIEANWVRMAIVDDEIAGFIARKGTEIHALALRPNLQGTGVARTLMLDAQRNAKKLGLWSYQANDRATRFYGKAGFIEVARTDGADNDAHLPDIRFEWYREEV